MSGLGTTTLSLLFFWSLSQIFACVADWIDHFILVWFQLNFPWQEEQLGSLARVQYMKSLFIPPQLMPTGKCLPVKGATLRGRHFPWQIRYCTGNTAEEWVSGDSFLYGIALDKWIAIWNLHNLFMLANNPFLMVFVSQIHRQSEIWSFNLAYSSTEVSYTLEVIAPLDLWGKQEANS